MLEEMLEKWRRGTRGPLPHLTQVQLLTALVLIDQDGPVGRRALAQALQINDGITRGLLERLAEQGLVEVNEGTGVRLSKQGHDALQKYLKDIALKKIQTLSPIELVPGKVSVGVHLAKRYSADISGLSQRDEAIKAGADGTITMAMIHDDLVIPPDRKRVVDLSRTDDSNLRSSFKLTESDLLIIGFGIDAKRALSGALAAVLSLEKTRQIS